MSEQLNNHTLLQQHPDICSREFDGETVMMNSSLDKYFGLDEVGTRIWSILKEKHTLREIVLTLTSEYDIQEENCLNDITPFIESLIEDELVIVLDN